MKSFALLSLASLVAALVPRQIPSEVGGSPSNTVNDVPQTAGGACKDVYLIIARGSIEPGNMGVIIGPPLCKFFKEHYGERAGCQGVGGGYKADILDNIIYMAGAGTSAPAIKAAEDVFKDAYAKCPKSLLVFMGYSQGAAVMHAAVSALPEDVKKNTVAGVLFGSTKHRQTGGKVANYPVDQIGNFCNKDDGICAGASLTGITAGHLTYMNNGDVKKASEFLISKVDPFLKPVLSGPVATG